MEARTKIVPLFPLAKVVLFPRALLSIQISLHPGMIGLGDYLAQDAELCLALQRDVKESLPLDTLDMGTIFHTACVGRVVNKENVSKNDYKVLIEGIERVRILEQIRHKPITQVNVEVLHDYVDLSKKTQLSSELQELLELSTKLGEMLPHFKPIIKSIVTAYPHPAIIADLITYTFIKDNYTKLSILEELDSLRRVKLVLIQVKHIFHRLNRQRNRDKL